MVNLTIRLSKAGASPGAKHEPVSTPATSEGPSIPPHLVDVDLPLAKGLGILSTDACGVNFVGVKARRRPGDKVHICVRCNFPIAVYGRLDPCEHVYCLTCAKLDSTCFLCDERVVRIQKLDVLEGIFICGAPGCLRSFLGRTEFEWHVAETHFQLLQAEPEKTISPVKSSAPPTPLPQLQAHLQQPSRRQVDLAIPSSQGRQNPGTLQLIIPKKEEVQRKPPKILRQDLQGPQARPIPELHLPDQFPHHRGGDNYQMGRVNHERGVEFDSRDNDREIHQQRYKEWEVKNQVQRERLKESDHAREGQRTERGGEMGSNQPPWGQERDWDRELQPHPHPPPPPPKEGPRQRDRLAQTQASQQPMLIPPPPPYPPPNYPPAFPPQQEANGFPPRFEPSMGFHPGMPIPPRPDYQEATPRPRHRGPLMGGQQEGDRPMNASSQDGFGQNGPSRPMNPSAQDGFRQSGPPSLTNANSLDGFRQSGPPSLTNANSLDGFGQNGPLRPHFHGDYGPPMGMPPMDAPRFYEGHLPLPPPPPLGPPPKRAKFSGHPVGHVQGEMMMDYGWGVSPGNFGGRPAGRGFPGWMPPTNA